MSTQPIIVAKWIGADVKVIRYELENKNVAQFVWTHIMENLADAGTKIDNTITCAPNLALLDGRLPLAFPTAKLCEAGRPLGCLYEMSFHSY